MGYLAFALTTLFLPGMPAGATIPRWGLLAVAVPAIMLLKSTSIPKGAWIVAAYITCTLVLSGATYSGLNGYCFFCILLGAFCIGREQLNLKPVFVGVALGLWLNSLAVTGQVAGWWVIPDVTARGGLFMNRNSASEAAAMVAVGLVFYGERRLLWGLIPTLLAGSRAPILALGVVGICALWKRSRLLAVACLVGFLAAAYLLSALAGGQWTGTSVVRLDVWRDVLPALTLLGHGIGSFEFDFPTLQAHTNALVIRFDHPHFEALQILYELGGGGVFLILLFLYRLGRVQPDAAVYALAVFAIEGCTAFPLYMPVTGFLAALCAGYISRPGVPLREHFPALGRGVQSWDRPEAHRTV